MIDEALQAVLRKHDFVEAFDPAHVDKLAALATAVSFQSARSHQSPKRSPALRSLAKRASRGRSSFSISGSLTVSFQMRLRRVPAALPPSQT